MAISITINGGITLDESDGLQIGGAGSSTEDNNDSDVLLSTLPADFAERLFVDLGLDDQFADDNGVAHSAGNYISLTGTGSVVSLGFTTSSGGALPIYGVDTVGAACNLTTLDGHAIKLFADPASELGSRVVYGVDAVDNSIVFAMYMDPAAGLLSASVWMVQFEPLDNPLTNNHDDPLTMSGLGVGAGTTTEFNFNELPSGANLFGMLGSGTSGLIVFGTTTALKGDGTYKNPGSDVIQTSQAGPNATIGVNSQMFDAGDSAYFTYVKNPNANYTSSNLSPNEADDADNLQYGDNDAATNDTLQASSAFLEVAQIQSGTIAGMTITAYDLAGSPKGRTLLTESGNNAVEVTRVVVYAADGITVLDDSDDPAGDNTAISFDLSGIGATVTGFEAGYKIEWYTSAPHDQVKIAGISGKFDIGGFGINEATAIFAPLTDVRFEDDGPAVDLVLNGAAALRLDETDNDADDLDVGGILATNSLAAAAYLTTDSADFGTDGEATASPTVWSLSLTGANVNGVDSGLDDAATNSNVMLFVSDAQTIVGKVGGSGGALVMTITIDATTGELTVVQNRAVEHNDSDDHDEAGTSSAMMNSGLVAAVRTITDGDGDSASDSVDVSQVIKLEDDGPNVDITLDPTAALILDETDADADDSNIVGGILATNSLATSVYLDDNNVTYGSDGPAGASPTVWSLNLTGANVNGVDSGLDDTATNTNVMLFVVNATTVVGKAGSAAGPVVMTISINATTGELTVVQERAVEHDNPLDHDENGTSSAVMNSGLVAAVKTATDGDGDSHSDSVDISQVIKLEDDGPDVDLNLLPAAALVLDETDNDADDNAIGGILASASLATAGYLNINSAFFGSDGQAGASPSVWSLTLAGANPAGVDSGLDDTLTDTAVMLFVVNSTTIVGKAGDSNGPVVMTITIDAANGTINVVQERAVEHDNSNDDDESASPAVMGSGLVFANRTITDGDGDHDSDSVDISQVIKLEDDGPVIDIELKGTASVTVDESSLPVPASGSITAANLFDVVSQSFGSDGAGTVGTAYRLLLADDNSGLFDTATLDEVLLSINAEGTLITGKVSEGGGDVTVFTIALNPSSGLVTLTQHRAMVHDDADHDEANSPLTLPSELVYVRQTITDGDDDSDSDDVDISQIFKFEDDGPTLLPPEDDPIVLLTDDSNIIEFAELSTDVIFPDTPDFGSDGPNADDPEDFVLRLATENGNSGLVDTATGRAILLKTVGSAIVGYVDADGNGSLAAGETTEAIRYSLTAVDADTSTVRFTQTRSVVHANVNDPDEAGAEETVAPNLVTIEQIAIDGDDDVSGLVSFDLGAITFIRDDGPAIGPIDDSIVDFAAGQTVTKTLNGDVGNDPKTNPYILTSQTTSLVVNGVTVQAVVAANAQSVAYWADTGNNGTFGDAGDTKYYELTLNQAAAGTYEFEVFVNPPPAFTEFSFDLLPSGANLFGVVTSGNSALLVMGEDPVYNAAGNYTNASDVIHTSQGGDGATIGVNNQMFDPGDGAYFTFINDPDPDFISGAPGGLTATEADDIDNVQYNEDGIGPATREVNSAFLGISQTQSGKPVSLTIEAFNIAGGPQEEAFDAALGTNPVDITAVRVKNALGQDVSASVSISITDGVATVGGLLRGYTVEWDTSAPHDQVLITGVTGKFDVGRFGFLQTQPTPDQLLQFTAQVTDGDGDTDSASWAIGIDGTGIHNDGEVTGVSALTTLTTLSTSQEYLYQKELGPWVDPIHLIGTSTVNDYSLV